MNDHHEEHEEREEHEGIADKVAYYRAATVGATFLSPGPDDILVVNEAADSALQLCVMIVTDN